MSAFRRYAENKEPLLREEMRGAIALRIRERAHVTSFQGKGSERIPDEELFHE